MVTSPLVVVIFTSKVAGAVAFSDAGTVVATVPLTGGTAAFTTNTLSLGSSYKLTPNITASAAWVHGFRNEISGGIVQVPGATARFDVQSDAIWLGLNVRFGKTRRLGPTPSPEESYMIPASPPVATAAAPPPTPRPDDVVPASVEGVDRKSVV